MPLPGPVPLRRRLLLVVVAGILPITLSATAGLVAMVRLQEAQSERSVRELTRALGTAVDAELRRSIAVVQTLGTSPTLDRGELAAFLERADRVVALQGTWLAIVLTDPAGTPVLRTGVPLGASLPPLPEPAMLAEAVQTRTPVVGGLTPGAPDWPSFGVYVPLVRDGVVRHVLVALVKPDAILALVTRQQVPNDWLISVFDRGGLRVARSRRHTENLGTPGAPSLLALMAQGGDEGFGETLALEGDAIYSAYSRLPDLHWSVATGVPTRIVDDAMRRSTFALAAGLLASLLIGGVAAFAIARSIAQPMAVLRRAAGALGRREAFDVPASRIEEIHGVGDALVAAAAERARGEADREALLRREREARAAAERANRAKDEFLAMLGHELRNPLGAISNAVALLERPDASDEQRKRTWPIVTRQTKHLLHLTNDLLDAGRAITGKIVLARRPLDLATAVEHALHTVELTGRQAERRLQRALDTIWIDGDSVRVEQIVTNLVGNAIKFTAPNGTIRVTVARDGDDAVLSVADDGIGMSPELVARAFELFAQGAQPLDRVEGGLGIGLTLVRRLAELHGGTATVHSDGPGRGTIVQVRLPAIATPAANRPTVAGGTHAPGGRDVLIVEDNDDVRESLRTLLELAGHRVREAGDGNAALEAVAAAVPEIALIDVGLPGIDGYEVARRIRATAGRGPWLLALTGYGSANDRARSRDAGFDGHLVKPVDPVELERLVGAGRSEAAGS